MTKQQPSRRSLMIYSLGAVVLVFIGLMALIEANEAGNRRQQTTTAIYATNTQIRMLVYRTETAVMLTRNALLSPSLTFTPTVRK